MGYLECGTVGSSRVSDSLPACLSVLTGDGDVPGKPRTLHCEPKNKKRERKICIWPCEGGYPAMTQPLQPGLHNNHPGHTVRHRERGFSMDP